MTRTLAGAFLGVLIAGAGYVFLPADAEAG